VYTFESPGRAQSPLPDTAIRLRKLQPK